MTGRSCLTVPIPLKHPKDPLTSWQRKSALTELFDFKSIPGQKILWQNYLIVYTFVLYCPQKSQYLIILVEKWKWM
jgi:hypothetical protein